MQRTLLLSASAFVVAWATSAVANSPNLKGDYGFTGTSGCLVAPGSGPTPQSPGNTTPYPNAGFQPDLRPKDALPGAATDSFYHSDAVEGIRTFNGDGTGTVSGTSIGVTPRPTPGPPVPPGFPRFPPAAGSSVFSYNFTYTVNGDGSWTATMVPNSFKETFVTGPRSTQNPMVSVNQTATIDTIPEASGFISQDGKTLILVAAPIDSGTGGFTPTVETVTYSNGDVWPQICHRSRVLISLSNGK
jgi:hypothetical protein